MPWKEIELHDCNQAGPSTGRKAYIFPDIPGTHMPYAVTQARPISCFVRIPVRAGLAAVLRKPRRTETSRALGAVRASTPSE